MCQLLLSKRAIFVKETYGCVRGNRLKKFFFSKFVFLILRTTPGTIKIVFKSEQSVYKVLQKHLLLFQLVNLYRNSDLSGNFIDIQIETFSRGSIIVDYYVLFDKLESPITTQVNRIIQTYGTIKHQLFPDRNAFALSFTQGVRNRGRYN